MNQLDLARNIQTAKYNAMWHMQEYRRTRVPTNLFQACNFTCKALRLKQGKL